MRSRFAILLALLLCTASGCALYDFSRNLDRMPNAVIQSANAATSFFDGARILMFVGFGIFLAAFIAWAIMRLARFLKDINLREKNENLKNKYKRP